MSTATTQHQYTQHYQQQQQQQQYHLQQQQKMDPNNKASSTQTSTSSSMMNNAQCRPCLNRFLEFRNQAINRMTLEYQKIWTGQGVPAVRFVFIYSFTTTRHIQAVDEDSLE